jgi:hypothetical protein
MREQRPRLRHPRKRHKPAVGRGATPRPTVLRGAARLPGLAGGGLSQTEAQPPRLFAPAVYDHPVMPATGRLRVSRSAMPTTAAPRSPIPAIRAGRIRLPGRAPVGDVRTPPGVARPIASLTNHWLHAQADQVIRRSSELRGHMCDDESGPDNGTTTRASGRPESEVAASTMAQGSPRPVGRRRGQAPLQGKGRIHNPL